MPNKPKKDKTVSLKKTAKTYRKSHTKPKTDERGAHMFNSQSGVYSTGRSTSTLDYKPKPRSLTKGTDSALGGGTKYIKRARSK